MQILHGLSRVSLSLLARSAKSPGCSCMAATAMRVMADCQCPCGVAMLQALTKGGATDG